MGAAPLTNAGTFALWTIPRAPSPRRTRSAAPCPTAGSARIADEANHCQCRKRTDGGRQGNKAQIVGLDEAAEDGEHGVDPLRAYASPWCSVFLSSGLMACDRRLNHK